MQTVSSTDSPQDPCAGSRTSRRVEPAACRGRVPRPWNDVTLICPFARVTLPLCALVIGSLSIRHAQQPEIRFGAHTLGSTSVVSSSSATVTDAFMTTALTDRAGASLGDALALVDQVAQGERQLAYRPLRP